MRRFLEKLCSKPDAPTITDEQLEQLVEEVVSAAIEKVEAEEALEPPYMYQGKRYGGPTVVTIDGVKQFRSLSWLIGPQEYGDPSLWRPDTDTPLTEDKEYGRLYKIVQELTDN